MRISLRGWIVLGSIFGLLAALAITRTPSLQAQTQDTTLRPGQLTEDQLGGLLRAMGLRPKKELKRYDFAFKAVYKGEEWELSMSTVLSQNGQSVWVMAWLDELPKTAADVPRTALLRLLAANDRLGQGKFFAYVPSNRRFVLQRVVDNQNLTTSRFRDILKELGSSVVQTYPQWSVANWKKPSSSKNTAGKTPSSRNGTVPSQPNSSGRPGATGFQPKGLPKQTVGS
jgi:hypothetical protein